MTDAFHHLNSGENLMGNRRITWFSWGDIWVDWSLEVFHWHVVLSTNIFTLVWLLFCQRFTIFGEPQQLVFYDVFAEQTLAGPFYPFSIIYLRPFRI